jgi:hypothetical protein
MMVAGTLDIDGGMHAEADAVPLDVRRFADLLDSVWK